MLLSALIVTYRDFRYVVTFLVQLWLFATPVLYPVEIIPARWQLLYSVNPMVGMVEGFRGSRVWRAVFRTTASLVSPLSGSFCCFSV